MAGQTLKILDELAPAALHHAVWETCQAPRWYFGNRSVGGDAEALPFWKMKLGDAAAVTQLWEHARSVCESLAGRRLRVVRQYANGHTYGLGGRPHRDDVRDGTFTLLYYPMPEWREDWEGETLFFGPRGNVIAGVVPRPNRAVFFDSRLAHAGRAPSRTCPALRVTVAYKLETALEGP
ncbi:MAG TPA: 2OG-Fe(II) oxygenase [Candidatus Binatia bacterium]|nr:2OG-Fe(II) oxygenase [Candidatus Binatia bacterium]